MHRALRLSAVFALLFSSPGSFAIGQVHGGLLVVFDKHDFMLPMIVGECEILCDTVKGDTLFADVTCLNHLVYQMDREKQMTDVFEYFGPTTGAAIPPELDSAYQLVRNSLQKADRLLRVSENIIHDRIEFQWYLYEVVNKAAQDPIVNIAAPIYYNGWYVGLDAPDIPNRIRAECMKMFSNAYPAPKMKMLLGDVSRLEHIVPLGDSAHLNLELDSASRRWVLGDEFSWRMEMVELDRATDRAAAVDCRGQRCSIFAESEQTARLIGKFDDGIHAATFCSTLVKFRRPTTLAVSPSKITMYSRPPWWGKAIVQTVPLTLWKSTRHKDSAAFIEWTYSGAYTINALDSTRARKPRSGRSRGYYRGERQLSTLDEVDLSFMIKRTGWNVPPQSPLLRVRQVAPSEENRLSYNIEILPEEEFEGGLRLDLHENGSSSDQTISIDNRTLGNATIAFDMYSTVIASYMKDTVGQGPVRYGISGFGMTWTIYAYRNWSFSWGFASTKLEVRSLNVRTSFGHFGIQHHSPSAWRFLSDVSYGASVRFHETSIREIPEASTPGSTTPKVGGGVGMGWKSRPFGNALKRVITLNAGYYPVNIYYGEMFYRSTFEIRLGVEFDVFIVRMLNMTR